MSTHPANRTRMVSEVISGAQGRIFAGEFGVGAPNFDLYDVDPRSQAPGIYFYHEGDLFTPGAGNYVYESWFELPLQTVWGKGFLRTPNVFNPIQAVQVFSQPNVVNNGIGGLQSGQLELEPLQYTHDSSQSF